MPIRPMEYSTSTTRTSISERPWALRSHSENDGAARPSSSASRANVTIRSIRLIPR